MWTLCWRLAERWARAPGARSRPRPWPTKVSPVAGDFLAVAVLLWLASPPRPGARPPWPRSTGPRRCPGSAAPCSDTRTALTRPLAVCAWPSPPPDAGSGRARPSAWPRWSSCRRCWLAPAVAGALIAGVDARLAVRRVAAAAAGGLAAIVLAFSPFALAGTLPAAVVHVNNSWLPGPTSGGSPNVWWLVGHVMTTLRQGGSLLDRVQFIFDTTVGLPFYAVGRVLWITSAAGHRLPPAATSRPPPRHAGGGDRVLLLRDAGHRRLREPHPHPLPAPPGRRSRHAAVPRHRRPRRGRVRRGHAPDVGSRPRSTRGATWWSSRSRRPSTPCAWASASTSPCSWPSRTSPSSSRGGRASPPPCAPGTGRRAAYRRPQAVA